MKIIFLNCWKGRVWNNLSNFLKKQRKNTDIFALSEVTYDLHKKVSKILVGFSGIDSHKNIGLRANYEISVFYNKKLKIEKSYINNIKSLTQGDFLVTKFDIFAVNTVHGFSAPGDKKDSVDRLKQSESIINFMKKYKILNIIGGDFNLNPDTKSIKMIEEAGFINLIKKYNIKSTRNHYSWEQAEDQQKKLGLKFFGKQYFADYCFVSPDIKVKSFRVPDIEISDHLPLILEFEV